MQQNPLAPYSLSELLAAHPLTRREVGKIPANWLDRVQDKESAIKQIYKAIKHFQGKKDTINTEENQINGIIIDYGGTIIEPS